MAVVMINVYACMSVCVLGIIQLSLQTDFDHSKGYEMNRMTSDICACLYVRMYFWRYDWSQSSLSRFNKLPKTKENKTDWVIKDIVINIVTMATSGSDRDRERDRDRDCDRDHVCQ